MLKTKTKKELNEIKDMVLYDDLCALSDLLNIGFVSSHKGFTNMNMMDYINVMSDQAKQKLIVITL